MRATTKGAGMAQVTRASVADIDLLASSWRLHLATERKSAATITAYSYATTQLASSSESRDADRRRPTSTRPRSRRAR